MVLEARERPAVDPGESPSSSSEKDQDSVSGHLSSGKETPDFGDTRGFCGTLYEGWEKYKPGGQCPLDLGTVIDETYRLLYKVDNLSDCISWIARNHKTSELVQLDIFSARCSEGVANSNSVGYYKQFLEKRDLSKPNYFQSSLDELWIDSPNGRHLCQVLELQVLSVEDLVGTNVRGFSAEGCRDLFHTLLQGLCELHDQGFAFDCLNTDNLLYTSVEANTFSDQQLRQALGNPRVEELQSRRKGCNPPNTSTFPTSLEPFLKVSCQPRLEGFPRIIKIGDSSRRIYPRDGKEHEFFVYTPPEPFCKDKIPTASDDIWRAGCVIFEIVTGEPLFYVFEPYQYFSEMQDTLGPLPDKLRREFDLPWDLVRQHVRFLPFFQRRHQVDPLSKRIRERYGDTVSGKNSPVSEPTPQEDLPPLFSDEEHDLLTDLLQKMLEYDPSRRITAKEALKHPWFSLQSS